MALTVVAINHGNYLGRGEEYVTKLRRMVMQHLTIPHEFVCLTEKELGNDLKGWWVKIKLAEPGRFSGDVLYLDLDIVITDVIAALPALLASDRSKLWMRDDFSYPLNGKHRQDLDFETRKLLGGPGCCNSSVMLWHSDTLAPVWERWQQHKAQIVKTLHGDQNFISQVMWPDKIAFIPEHLIGSYKYGKLRKEPIAPIMIFHGKPKVHELERREPLRQLWESAA